jgi:excisionase family DNA binding protein
MAKARALAFPEQTPEADEPLLRLGEAAQRLGLRPETLKKMAQRREIPSVKYARLRLFEPRAIRAFIAAHREG